MNDNNKGTIIKAEETNNERINTEDTNIERTSTEHGPHKRNVCLLNDSFPPFIDGVANTVVNYAKVIEGEFGHAMVVTPSNPGADDRIFSFPVVRYPSLDATKIIGYRAGIPFSPEISKRLRADRVEILHSHCPVASTILGRELRSTMKIPLIMTYHTKFDIEINKAVKSKLLRWEAVHAIVENISACDEIWAVSKGAEDNLRSLGYKGDVVIMPNGADVPKGKIDRDRALELVHSTLPDKYEEESFDGMPLYLFVGRMFWYKGLRIILDALKTMHSKNKDFRTVFIGGGGDIEEVEGYTKSLGLDEKVIFTGKIFDREVLKAWYSLADLFLFPSTYDTNGLVVMEAAATSTPSIVIRDSAPAEMINDDINGYLIEENAESMAAKLEELYEKPDAVKKVGENAAKEVYLSWNDAIKIATDRYEIVIDKYKRGEYKTRPNITGEFFRLLGTAMDVMGKGKDILDNSILSKGIWPFDE